MRRKNILLVALIVIGLALIVDGSSGDRSQIFNECLDRCHSYNCTRSGSATLSRHDLTQPLYLTLLGWSCIDECKYTCMWVTVDKFVRVYKHDVPQFYGKWPFVRIFGLQEPASVFASLLNLFASCYMIKKLIKQVRISRRTPFKWLWYSFSAVCINTWIWSTIFHTRDLWLTEIMDYFSAFLLVLSQLNVFFVRSLWPHQAPVMLVLNASSLIYYIYHCYYLSMIKFDYGYNMTVNIVVGLVNSACWIAWSIYYYLKHKRRMKYMWRCAFSFVLFDLLMVLEIFDFSPIWWTFDSHALWHFSTVVIPLQWFQFIIDDVTFMQFEATYEKLT